MSTTGTQPPPLDYFWFHSGEYNLCYNATDPGDRSLVANELGHLDPEVPEGALDATAADQEPGRGPREAEAGGGLPVARAALLEGESPRDGEEGEHAHPGRRSGAAGRGSPPPAEEQERGEDRRGPAAIWSSSFRSGRMANPAGTDAQVQRDSLDSINRLNRMRLDVVGDPEIATRINAFEMAYRMQTSAPELMDVSGETQETLDLYGVERGKPSFAYNCLLASRLIERGVRFVQLYHTDWDHHGNKGTELGESLDKICLETDRGAAALVKDLKRLGLLENTLVIWGGEFGRTAFREGRTATSQVLGRDHYPDCYTMWMAGGGARPGTTYGAREGSHQYLSEIYLGFQIGSKRDNYIAILYF